MTLGGAAGDGDAEAAPAWQRLAVAVGRTAVQTAGRRPTGRTHDDADGDTGTFGTDDALGFDPRPVLAALDRAGVPVVAIGQVAGILHGSAELTGDLDLLWSGDAALAPAMASAFAELGAELADDDGCALACTAESFALPKVVFRTATASGDCCTPSLPWGSLDVRAFLDRSAVVQAPDGTRVRFLNRADLIAMRRAVGRPKDLRRAAELERLEVP